MVMNSRLLTPSLDFHLNLKNFPIELQLIRHSQRYGHYVAKNVEVYYTNKNPTCLVPSLIASNIARKQEHQHHQNHDANFIEYLHYLIQCTHHRIHTHQVLQKEILYVKCHVYLNQHIIY